MTTASHGQQVGQYFNDQTEPFYLEYWDSEDIHFGLFEPGEDENQLKQTLKRMTHAVISPTNIQPDSLVVDAGCGVGGPALDLARIYGCKVVGLTISQHQIELAQAKTATAELQTQVQFEYADCSIHLPFPDNSVDVVFSMEAACHFSDRAQFIRETYRILKPGGYFAFNDWLAQDNISASDYQTFIQPICDNWVMVSLETRSSYSQLIQAAGLEIVEFIDFGEAMLENAQALKRSYLTFLLQESTGHQFPPEMALWKKQLKSLYDAWLNRYFTVERCLARKNA